jgi:homogentisate 1,2-dioxygenase
MGEEGFSSDSSLLYHRGVPSALVDATPWELPDQTTTENRPLLPRHLKLHSLFPGEEYKRADVVTGRRLVLGNADVRISYVAAGESSPLYRNALGDECVYVESGEATVETVFGVLTARQGDYVLLPRSTTHRWVPTGTEPLRAYVIEANSHIAPPKRYLSRYGSSRARPVLRARPARPDRAAARRRDRRRGPGQAPRLRGVTGTRYVVPDPPVRRRRLGRLPLPVHVQRRDFEPITGRVHQPPPVHQVFEGQNFVICNFVPRKVDYHPLAIPVPYYHANVDSDEVMFYCGGDYEARKGSGIGQGSISLHPAATATARSPAPSSARSARSSSTSSPSWSTRSAPWRSARAAGRAKTPAYPWTWSGRGPTTLSR